MDKKQLYKWCSIPVEQLESYPGLKVPFRLAETSAQMGELMAREFIDDIKSAAGKTYRAIVPCGPKCWYEPFTRIINEENVSLKNVTVFHMDECLDWEGRLLAENDPCNFRTFMLRHFYGPIRQELNVPEDNRHFPTPQNMYEIAELIAKAPVDYTLGGWGQDGHIAYNQTRRHPFSHISLDELKNCSIRVQENNLDTIIALGQRSYGAAYQFVPPMSVTLGVKECLGAKKVRVFSDTGEWKQTALRVALFSEETAEYPLTLLQNHPDAIITATYDTARHPISENPDWEFAGVNV